MANVIFDVGMHRGDDTDFYLKKGFRVVGIEANPHLVCAARDRFAKAITDGRLEVISGAIGETCGETEFYVNLDKDDWSSTDPSFGCRDGTRFEKIVVPTLEFASVLERYDDIYYVKIDIEGADRVALEQMRRVKSRPKYVSVEAHHLDYLAYLRAMGYSEFKLINQEMHYATRLPDPPTEGVYVEYEFGGHHSGPFGEETMGEWRDLEDAAWTYLAIKQVQHRNPGILSAWFDFHAKRPEPRPESAA